MAIHSTLAAGALGALASRQMGQVASNVSEGFQSFVEVLRGTDENHETTDRSMTLSDIESEVVRRLREVLQVAGFSANHQFDLVVSDSGRVWVSGAGEERGRIEDAINQSPQLVDLLQKRAQHGRSSLGWPRFAIASERAKLTSAPTADKTLGGLGGYPNW